MVVNCNDVNPPGPDAKWDTNLIRRVAGVSIKHARVTIHEMAAFAPEPEPDPTVLKATGSGGRGGNGSRLTLRPARRGARDENDLL